MATLLKHKALTFDDVHLIPRFSDIESRKREIDLSVQLNNSDIVLKCPFVASPMDTVSGPYMATSINMEAGGLAILHRYSSIEDQVNSLTAVLSKGCSVGAAIGINGDFLERAEALTRAGCRILCVDVAHGHHSLMREALSKLRRKYPEIHIMAGNVATPEGFAALESWGADSIRVGIGSGSICSTRLQTGHGYPMLQNLLDISNELPNRKAQVVSDGGIKDNGDISKALAAGADLVMMGSRFAGTDEAPGDIIDLNGELVKTYRGMSSIESQIEWRGHFSSNEGISATVPYKGSVKDVTADMLRAVMSGLSYSGSRTIKEFQRNAIMVEVSHASTVEATTHILKR